MRIFRLLLGTGGDSIAYQYKGYNPANNKHVTKYVREHYKSLRLTFDKAYYEQELKPFCESLDIPISTFIKQAIQHEIERIRN